MAAWVWCGACDEGERVSYRRNALRYRAQNADMLEENPFSASVRYRSHTTRQREEQSDCSLVSLTTCTDVDYRGRSLTSFFRSSTKARSVVKRRSFAFVLSTALLIL